MPSWQIIPAMNVTRHFLRGLRFGIARFPAAIAFSLKLFQPSLLQLFGFVKDISPIAFVTSTGDWQEMGLKLSCGRVSGGWLCGCRKNLVLIKVCRNGRACKPRLSVFRGYTTNTTIQPTQYTQYPKT